MVGGSEVSVVLGAVLIPRMVPSRPLDEHGWADANPLEPAPDVTGVIQEQLPGPQPDGDFGAWEPGQVRKGVAYLEDKVNPGDVLSYNDVIWRVLDARKVNDPTGDHLTTWVCQVEEVSTVMVNG
jgi:hypothetical protein